MQKQGCSVQGNSLRWGRSGGLSGERGLGPWGDDNYQTPHICDLPSYPYTCDCISVK